MTQLICPNCNTVIEIKNLDDIVECPNCGTEVSKESAGGIENVD